MNDSRALRTSNLWTHSLKTLTLIVWLCVWTQRTAGQGPGAEGVTVGVGQTTTLTAPITTDILVFSWYRGTGTNQSQQIIGYVVLTSKQTNGLLYTGRESVTPDGTLTIRDLRMNDTGTYTVSVTRTDTSVTTASRQLSIYEYGPTVASKIDGLSDGAIAGIVIAALVVLAGMAALVYFFVFKKSASGAATTGNSTEMAPNNNEGSASPKANGTAAEIQYSSVNFVPKRGTPAKPVAPENTVYSEVRR